MSRSSLAFGYCDYTSEGVPFYVGIGNVARVRRLDRSNKKHTNVVQKHGIVRRVECVSINAYDLLIEWEKSKIVELHTYHYDYPTSLGSNFTTGGEGNPGNHHLPRIKSAVERQKISESKIVLYSSPDERQRLGEAIRKAKSDPIKLQNHALAQQKRYADPKERLKAHESNTQKKRVQQLTIDGEIIAEFPSLSYAVQITNVKNIKLVCQGKRPVAGGYVWRYVDFIEGV